MSQMNNQKPRVASRPRDPRNSQAQEVTTGTEIGPKTGTPDWKPVGMPNTQDRSRDLAPDDTFPGSGPLHPDDRDV